MKFLISITLFVFLAMSSLARVDETIRHTGKITDATERFPQALGHECSIELKPVVEKGASTKQFNVTLKVAGMKKKDAPLKKMFLHYGEKHVYESGGTKNYRKVAQRLFVHLDASETKVLKWIYHDGTEDWSMTYVCE